MLDFLPKSLNEFTVPEEMDQAFCVLFAESTYVRAQSLFWALGALVRPGVNF